MKYYYYIYANKGMTSSGSFSKDKSRWIKFNQAEVESLNGKKPYGATYTGAFISIDKF